VSIDKILQNLKTSCQKYVVPPPSVSFSLLAILKGILMFSFGGGGGGGGGGAVCMRVFSFFD
jgi:hypothetical protein